MCKIKVIKDCLWKQRTHKNTTIGDSIRAKLYRKILLPDSGIRFFQLVPANTNRSAALIENPEKCFQNVYSRFGLIARKRLLYHRAYSRRPCLHHMCPAASLLLSILLSERDGVCPRGDPLKSSFKTSYPYLSYPQFRNHPSSVTQNYSRQNLGEKKKK